MNVIDQSHSWIGLSRVGWKWSDQSNSSFRMWGNGEPDGKEYCVFTRLGVWGDMNCGRKIPFICSSKHSNFMPINKYILLICQHFKTSEV